VEAALQDSEKKKTKTDVKKVLDDQIKDVFKATKTELSIIVEVETNAAKNASSMDAISRVAANMGQEDPTVVFITVPDKLRCKECERLHLLEDGITPRAWKQSEVSSTYHKRGDNTPSMMGLHPSCRCSLSVVLPGYGFVGGKLSYISKDHDEYKHQRT
jgi:hypothetical protein